MPINPSIPLQVRGPQYAQATVAGQQARQQNQLFDIAQQDRAANKPLVDTQRSNEMSMEALKADVIGAERLRQFVEAGDLQGGLADRQQELARLRESGIPTKSVEASILAIQEAQQSGDLTVLKQGLDARRQIGERLGILKSDSQLRGTLSKPSADIEQYREHVRQAQAAGQQPLPYADPNAAMDFVRYAAKSRVGAQFGAPTDVPGVGVVQPSRTEGPAGNVVISPEANVVAAGATRAGADATAKNEAEATAEQKKEFTANQRTLEVWNVAKGGLERALSGTRTGPEQALVPAVTAGQQTADGAVAAVAPVLKQLFRSAGEGVFTDRDQALLLEMVPTREDHEETRVAKLQMIDAIIQAKLAASIPGSTDAPGGANDPLGIR